MLTIGVRLKRYTQMLFLLSLICATTCSLATAQAEMPNQEAPPSRGLRVLRFDEGSEAERIGMQSMDLLARMGDFPVTDESTFFRAKEAYSRSTKPFEIVYWRGRQRMTATVRSSTLGIYFNEYSGLVYELEARIKHVTLLREIPEYERDVEFKNQFKVPLETQLDEVRSFLDRAEQQGTLSPSQILVARISLIFDDASPEEIKKQSEMVGHFIATEPARYVYYAGEKRFFENKHYRPAIQCFKKYLEVDPDDVSVRLNLGFAAYHLGMWDEAEAAADYVLKDPESVSEYGSLVAYQVKAMGALGRKDYETAIRFAEKAFALNQKSFDITLVQIAAAQSGNLEKVREATASFQKVDPKRYDELRFQIDAIEAYALARANQREPAKQLVMKWKSKDRAEGRLNSFWNIFPGGSEVAKTWKELAAVD
jgi:tetratricopeptide (TPR) repeat protein